MIEIIKTNPLLTSIVLISFFWEIGYTIRYCYDRRRKREETKSLEKSDK